MLELRELRRLTISNPPAGRPSHLSAGSGIVRRGDYIYVVGDDELYLGVFNVASSDPGEFVRLFEGELTTDVSERHRYKPDLESATALRPFLRNPYGALLALGSGSGDTRDRGFVWSLEEDGSLRGFPRVVDTGKLFEFLRQHVSGRLNIEGCAATDESLYLFNRGNSENGKDMVFELSLEKVIDTLSSDFAIDPSELLNVRSYELGESRGFDLNFTDGDSLEDGRLVFSCAAEGEDEEHEFGFPAGSAIGVIGTDGEIQSIDPLADPDIKIEGVDAILNDGLIELMLVADADDLEVASPLLAGTIAEGRG